MATLEDVCNDYLHDLPYQQWADWSIKDPKRRELAASWLAEQIRSVGERVVTAHGGTLDTDQGNNTGSLGDQGAHRSAAGSSSTGS